MQLDLLRVTPPAEGTTRWRVGSVWGKREFESLAEVAGHKLINARIAPDERYPWNGGAAERWYVELCREDGGLRPPRRKAIDAGGTTAGGAVEGSICDPNLVSERLCFRLAQQEESLAPSSIPSTARTGSQAVAEEDVPARESVPADDWPELDANEIAREIVKCCG